MQKGWFRRAKIKWVNKNVYSFEFSKSGLFGSDEFIQRYDSGGKLRFLYEKPNWYLDMIKQGGFAERFVFCYQLRKAEKFCMSFTLKKNIKY